MNLYKMEIDMKNLNAVFVLGAARPEQFPALGLPETAFCGRSNVGKSSLINSIVLNKNMAKTSSTPGKTQQINFFIIEEKWILADLPGFGYAAIGKEHREKWAKLNWDYLEKRDNLKLVCVLIDSRHDPMPQDLELIERLELADRRYIIILTKCDKINKKAIEDRKKQIETLVSQCKGAIEVLPYSAVKAWGRDELLAIFKKNLI